MPTVTNAYDAHKQVEDYIDDAVNALDDAEKTLLKINYDDADSIQSEVEFVLDKITDAIYALKG